MNQTITMNKRILSRFAPIVPTCSGKCKKPIVNGQRVHVSIKHDGTRRYTCLKCERESRITPRKEAPA